MSVLSGWGRYPRADCHVVRARNEADVARAVARAPLIARGNGRAYGDASLNPGQTLDMRGMDRMLSFDAETGTLVAEAGVLLAEIIAAFLPRGWFPAVTPGTKFVSLGGAIAADVHGKNHHRDGGFSSFVNWVEVMGPTGTLTRAQPGDPMFDWTLGGMGLTGVIVRAEIRLRRVETAWILQDTQVATDLDHAIELFEATQDAPYSVAWIDCSDRQTGRALVMLGRHAELQDLPPSAQAAPFRTPAKRARRVPVDLPQGLLNRHSLRLMNATYFALGKRKAGERLVDWDSYFYPLDALLDWNRLYGKAGFLQFQCALPEASAAPGLAALLSAIAASGQGSVLSVLKRFGPGSGAFSFPMAGYTLALDFPRNDRSLQLMTRLDRITIDHDGRFYLAKDARLPRSTLAEADPRVEAFAAMRREGGLGAAFTSLQSERLGL